MGTVKSLLLGIDGGFGHGCLLQELLTFICTGLFIITKSHYLRTRNISETFHCSGTTHTQTNKTHTDCLQLRSSQPQYTLLSCRTLGSLDNNGTILPFPLSSLLCGLHSRSLACACTQYEVHSGDKGYEELCKRDDIDLVYIAADWLHHFPVAKCALENGKNVAIEVPSAMNLQECWDLINLSESTRKHCFILENCCYDWFEMNTLNMAQHGVFGEVIRAQGAYIHNLSPFWDYYWKNGENDKLGWRLDYNMKHRGDVYATHGLGPVAQALDIHRGDRMETLVAMDTKSVVGKELVEKRTGEECREFRNGDHTTTMIRTANGKVIEIQHNVMTPQPYNRLYQLTGTKGFANKYPVEGYALDADQLSASGVQPKVDDLNSHGFLPETEMEALVEKYQHPILKKYGEMAKEVGGHGGMDFVMDSRLVYCLQNGLPLDMDVYDLAEWCCLAELGELSMDNGCAAVAFPDFTRGEWNVVKGYKHAYASPEEEAAAMEKAKAFTAKLKELGAKEWAEK